MENSKICIKCKIEKSINDFDIQDSKTLKRRGQCKSCQSLYYQKYKEENKEKIRDKWRKASRKYCTSEKRRNKTLSRYGLTIDTYNDMYDKQNGLCKICNSNLTLVVDHCHKTNIIRGLLCNQCNVGLGNFKDNIEILEKALYYIKNCGLEK